jgi:acetyl-CoA carboxylase biotin carboxylase subunit
MMKTAGVPILPGTEDSIKDVDEAVAYAEKIGYPVMIKASGGGGGRGLRVAYNKKELIDAISTARKESAIRSA